MIKPAAPICCALLLLLPCWAAAAAAAANASAVFNPMMGSWRNAPVTFGDPQLGVVRTVNVCEWG